MDESYSDSTQFQCAVQIGLSLKGGKGEGRRWGGGGGGEGEMRGERENRKGKGGLVGLSQNVHVIHRSPL